MAPRTGDKRLIVPPVKSTSAGLCLALVLAGLLLGGCGDGSSDPESSTAASEGSTQAAVSGEAAGPDGAEHASSKSTTSTQQASAKHAHAAAQQTPDAPAGQGQKHGPHIAQPKGPREQAPTPADAANVTVANMSLSSPSLPAGSGGPVPLSAAYTCDGGGGWPTLAWSGVPAGTAELILYAMNAAPVEGKLFVDWAVAGLNPALTGIEASKLPKGAVVGTNSFGKRGYEICPESSETYILAIYALPRALSPSPGFDARELRKEVLDVSGNAGLLAAAYAR